MYIHEAIKKANGTPIARHAWEKEGIRTDGLICRNGDIRWNAGNNQEATFTPEALMADDWYVMHPIKIFVDREIQALSLCINEVLLNDVYVAIINIVNDTLEEAKRVAVCNDTKDGGWYSYKGTQERIDTLKLEKK